MFFVFFWEVHRALWAFSAHFDNPLCTLGIKIFSLFHRSKWQVTLMESHTFSWLVTYSKSHMPVMRWKHLLLSLENTRIAYFVINCIYISVPQDTYYAHSPSHSQIWLLCCTTTNSKKTLLFSLVVMTSLWFGGLWKDVWTGAF